MSPLLRKGMLAGVALMSGAMTMACGPTIVNFDPSNVASIDVHPASKQKAFCPGERFKVEIIARLKNGTSCSNVDREMGCQGEKDAVMSPGMVRIEGSAGSLFGEPEKFTWAPPANVLDTADTGLTLRAYLEKGVEGRLQKSVVGENNLTPVYQCQMSAVFGGGYAGTGQSGGGGPDIDVAITTLSTPYYQDAALIRVTAGGSREYYISPSPGEPVTIRSVGQDGGAGEQGASGVKGQDGRNGSGQCENGENGRDGSDGGPGGPGADGGPGGVIHITVDKAAADSLRGRVVAQSLGGAAGPGGAGGPGGSGGSGGQAGPSGPNCSGQSGQSGRQGRTGQAGPSGRAGSSGPPPSFATAARNALFAEEAGTLQRIEGAKKK